MNLLVIVYRMNSKERNKMLKKEDELWTQTPGFEAYFHYLLVF